MVIVVFCESTFDGELLVLAIGIGEADLAGLKDGNDSGMMLKQGERTQLARHRDGACFALKQGLAR